MWDIEIANDHREFTVGKSWLYVHDFCEELTSVQRFSWVCISGRLL
jgi:hypothetical protein